MQAGEGFGEALVISHEPSEAGAPSEGALGDPAARQQHEAALGLGRLHHHEPDAVRRGLRGGRLAGVALVDEGDLHALAGGVLYRRGEAVDLRPVLLVRRRDMQRQQLAQRVDGEMHLRALPSLGAVVPGARPALRRRLQGAAVENGSRGVRGAAGGDAQEDAQIIHHGRERAGFDPAHRLLVNDPPRRQIVRHQPPRRPGAHDPAQPVEDLAQRPLALRRVLRQQAQIRRDERPLLVTDITRVRLACRLHPRNLSTLALTDSL